MLTHLHILQALATAARSAPPLYGGEAWSRPVYFSGYDDFESIIANNFPKIDHCQYDCKYFYSEVLEQSGSFASAHLVFPALIISAIEDTYQNISNKESIYTPTVRDIQQIPEGGSFGKIEYILCSQFYVSFADTLYGDCSVCATTPPPAAACCTSCGVSSSRWGRSFVQKIADDVAILRALLPYFIAALHQQAAGDFKINITDSAFIKENTSFKRLHGASLQITICQNICNQLIKPPLIPCPQSPLTNCECP